MYLCCCYRIPVPIGAEGLNQLVPGAEGLNQLVPGVEGLNQLVPGSWPRPQKVCLPCRIFKAGLIYGQRRTSQIEDT